MATHARGKRRPGNPSSRGAAQHEETTMRWKRELAQAVIIAAVLAALLAACALLDHSGKGVGPYL